MEEPTARRPIMPGYGVLGAEEGTGLLPWAWAEARLVASHDYWVVTTWPDGRPHAMPVWGIWDEGALWFSSSVGSRKIRNLRADPRCLVAISDVDDPVVVEGTAEIVSAAAAIGRFVERANAKYASGYSVEFLDPAVNATVRVRPATAFGLVHGDFAGSPTRWQFGGTRGAGVPRP